MNAIVIINDSNQDTFLFAAFAATMQLKDWNVIKEVDNSFIKNFTSNDPKAIIKLVKKDLDQAVVDAEWEKLKYIIITTDTIYHIQETK